MKKKIELVLLGLAVALILMIFGVIFGWICPVVIISASIIIFVVIYFVFAPRNMWFTFIEEGTAKWVVRGSHLKTEKTEEGKILRVTQGGQPIKCLIQWEGHTISQETGTDADGNSVTKWDVAKDGTVVNEKTQKEPHHLFGALRFFGWYPVDRIYAYAFEWTAITENGEIRRHPKEKLDYVLLKDDVYWARVEQAEDIELFPLIIETLFTMRVINPYKALFVPQNWLEMVINRSKPAVRNVMTRDTYRSLIKRAEAIGNVIYKDLRKRKLLEDEFCGRYGIDLRATEVKEINPLEEYRKETLKKWLAEREAEARATATGGTLIELVVVETGMSREKIQEELRDNTTTFVDKYTYILDKNWDLIYRRMAIDGGSFADIRVPQGTTLEGLATLWQRMPKGGGGPGKEEKKEVKTSGDADIDKDMEGLMDEADKEAKRLGL